MADRWFVWMVAMSWQVLVLAALENAVAAVIAEGRVRTYDMGGANSTLEMAEAVAARV